MEKKYIFILLLILCFGIVTAGQNTLGTKKAGDMIKLIQTCDGCTYENLSAIIYPDGTYQNLEVGMTLENNIWYYNWSSPKQEGTYRIIGHDDEIGTDEDWSYTVILTTQGEDTEEGISNVSIFLLIALIISLFVYVGISKLLGSMFIFVLGFGLLFTITTYGWIGWVVISAGFIMLIYSLMGDSGKRRFIRRRRF